MRDRLEVIRQKLRNRQTIYKIYNPKSDYLFDIENADEDIAWLIYEIERLRKKVGYPEADSAEK